MESVTLCYASAGAGKTHALVNTYLTCLLANPQQVSGVVAITFTKKATAEMKHRIAERLQALSKGDNPTIAQQLAETLHLTTDDIQKEATYLWSRYQTHYEDFAIMTIDSFFQRLVATFSQGLSLPADYTLSLNGKEIVADALTILWGKVSQEPALAHALQSLTRHRLEQGKSWDCRRDLKALGQLALTDCPQEETEDAALKKPSGKDFFTWCQSERGRFENAVRNQAHALLQRIGQANLTAADFAWGKQGLYGNLERLAQGSSYQLGSRLSAAATSSDKWAKKGSPHRARVLALVEEALLEPLQRLVIYHEKNHPHYASVKAVQGLYHALTTVHFLRAIVRMQALAKKEIPLAHLPCWLQRLWRGTTSTFLQKALGHPYHAFVIDEFQDLSQPQWDALQPLISETLKDPQGSLFVVGDVKQAIYRWRGGNVALLLHGVKDAFPHLKAHEKVLPYNWRSKNAIVAFNNCFFAHASQALHRHLQEVGMPSATTTATFPNMVTDTYQHVAQHCAQEEGNQGHVSITFFESEKGNAWREEALNRMVEEVIALQKEGYRAEEIAILVRDNRQVNAVTTAFAHHRREHPESSIPLTTTSRGFPLGKSPHIQLLIHTLRYLYEPRTKSLQTTIAHLYNRHGCGRVAREEAANTDHHYWQQGLHVSRGNDSFMPTLFPSEEGDRDGAWLLKHLQQEGVQWKHLGLYPLVQKLITTLGIAVPASNSYLALLNEHLHTLVRKGKEVADFLAWWESEGKEIPLRGTTVQGAIEVMTIHQAKGLAFPVLMVPLCDWPLDHPPHHPPILWEKGQEPPYDHYSLPIYYSKKLQQSHHAHAYWKEHLQSHLDNLNLLYVAFTRPQERLFIQAPRRGKEKLKAIGDLVARVMRGWEGPPATATEESGNVVFTFGEKAPPPKRKTAKQKQMTPKDPLRGGKHYEDLLGSWTETAEIQQGKWWHDLLATLPSRQGWKVWFANYERAGKISPKKAYEVLQELEAWCEDERVAGWFTSSYDILYRERDILTAREQVRRPDRVMVSSNRAVVVDFKTGTPQSGDKRQVGDYMDKMVAMGYEVVEGYLFYTKAREVVVVDRA